VPPDAPAALLDVPPSLPLGVANIPYPTHKLRVERGSLLVCYTDGLVERRGHSLTDSLAELVTTCDALRGVTASDATTQLLARLDTEQRNDDSVVLAVQLAPVDAPLELRVPATPRASRMVREPLKRWLRLQGLPDDDAGPLLVAVGEAVANAITHAYPAGFHGPITVDATRDRDGDGVVICVRDLGGWRLPRDTRGMGLQLIEALGHGVVQATDSGTTVWLRSTPAPAPV
jgi:anti-sigma regulatory factor (Ser/Thr protein kinase)